MLFYILKGISLKAWHASIDCNSSAMEAKAEHCKFSVSLSNIAGPREAWATDESLFKKTMFF